MQQRLNQSFARWAPRIAALAILVVAVLAAVRVSTHERESVNATAKVHGPKEITVAITAGNPPFFTLNGDGGREWVLIRSALSKTGHHVGRPLYVPLAEAVRLYEQGVVNAIWLAPAEQRVEAQKWHLSAPLLARNVVAVTLGDRALSPTTVEDLHGKKVGSLPDAGGLLSNALFSRITDDPGYEASKTDTLLLLKLFERRLDVILSERATFDYYRRLLPASVRPDQAVVYHDIFAPVYPRLVFLDPVMRDEFNAALEQLGGIGNSASSASRPMPGGSERN